MFSEEQLANIDGKYFNIICADGLDVTIQSRNTGHWWYLHSTGCVGDNACIIFHKHKYNHPYHQHGRTRSLASALTGIKRHDQWQMVQIKKECKRKTLKK